MKYNYVFLGLLLFLGVIAGVRATDYTTTGFTPFTLTTADTRFAGYKVVPNIAGTLSACLVANSGATNVYLYNATGTYSLLANITPTSGCANFNIQATLGSTYYVVAGSKGSSYNQNYTVAGTSYPYTGTGVNLTASGFCNNCETGGTSWTNSTANAFNIQNVTLTVQTFFSITANNNYTGSSLSVFNASINYNNGTNLFASTTNGTINTNYTNSCLLYTSPSPRDA